MIVVKRLVIVLLMLVMKGLLVKGQESCVLSGRIMQGKEPLPGATITVTRLSDSSRIVAGTSRDNGKFLLEGLPLHDSLIIAISYSGLVTFRRLLLLRQKQFTMQTVELQPAHLELDSVMVRAEKPIVIKGDTVEFRASTFKTPPNSMAQDMLKRIPGLEIDRNGKLTFNGRPVNKILVDGKVLFGEDGAVALSNISNEMVDKFQFANDSLANQQTESSQSQVLNLKLKAGNKYFGNGIFSAGTDKRHEGAGFGSVSRKKDRLSIYGGKNNINKTGSAGSSVTIVNSGSGITENIFSGLDYGLKLNGTKDISGTYQFNQPHTVKELIKERRQNILPGAQLITQSLSEGENESSNHKLAVKILRLEAPRPLFSSALDWTNSQNTSYNIAFAKDGQGNLLNRAENTYQSKATIRNWATEMGYYKKFQNWSISGNLTYTQAKQDLVDGNEGTTVFYKNNLIDSQYLFRQQIKAVNRTDVLNANFWITKKSGKYVSFRVRNKFALQWGSATRITWNLDSLGGLPTKDTNYSNDFRSCAFSNHSSFSVIYQKNGWKLMPGITLVQSDQEQKDFNRQTTIRKNAKNLVPQLDISSVANQKYYSLSYAVYVVLPALEQLQPVQEISNPLYINKGNPELNRTLEHNMRWSYYNRNFVVAKRKRFKPFISNASLFFNTSQDKIISSLQYDSLGRQINSYENVSGVYRVNGNFSTTLFQYKNARNSFLAIITPEINYLRDRIYLNGILNNTDNVNIQMQFNITYQNSDAINIILTYSPMWSDLNYEQNNTLRQSYWVQNLGIDIDLFFGKRIKLNKTMYFGYNNQLPAGFDKSSLLWNAQGSYLCLKNRKGEISFSAFDILKQFNNLTRTIAGNYIEDSQVNNLQQYFMLGFKYHFGAIEKGE